MTYRGHGVNLRSEWQVVSARTYCQHWRSFCQTRSPWALNSSKSFQTSCPSSCYTLLSVWHDVYLPGGTVSGYLIYHPPRAVSRFDTLASIPNHSTSMLMLKDFTPYSINKQLLSSTGKLYNLFARRMLNLPVRKPKPQLPPIKRVLADAAGLWGLWKVSLNEGCPTGN
jgi:hypothetical protein